MSDITNYSPAEVVKAAEFIDRLAALEGDFNTFLYVADKPLRFDINDAAYLATFDDNGDRAIGFDS